LSSASDILRSKILRPENPGFENLRADETIMTLGKMAGTKVFPRIRTLLLAVATTLALVTAIVCHAAALGASSVASWLVSVAYGLVLWVWWAAVIELLWHAGEHWPFALRVSPATIGANLAIAVVVALLHLGMLQLAAFWISRVGPELERTAYRGLTFFDVWRFGVEFLLYGVIWSACAAVNTQMAAQRDAIRSLELERQLSSAHLRALQMQLEPHFLFNTLNAITTLVELNRTQDALDILAHLNNILKTGLKRSTPSKIPLAQELQIVESYLAIERVRFADRLQVDINLDPSALDGLVPSFLLQPIIENAIRHGIAHCENVGCIETSVKRFGERVQIQVRDNGPGANGLSHPGFGIGLNNTRERLVHFYQDNYALRAGQPQSGGFEVSITIPYERTTT
jgi:signal transduction histidine kinase